jgi:hypothetical protein
MFNRFIALWKQKNKAIERETKRDFNNQLKIWQSHGKNMGLKIIAGLESEGGALENTMRNILRNSFNGDLLNEIVNKALSEFMRDHPAPTRPTGTNIPRSTIPPRNTGGGSRAIPINQMNLQQVTRALKRDAPRLRSTNNALIQLANWVTDPRSEGGRKITAGESEQLETLGRQRARLQRRVRRERRRRKRLMRSSNTAASTATQNTQMSGYQPMPTTEQYIKVELHSNDEPTVVQARRAAWMVAQKAKRA